MCCSTGDTSLRDFYIMTLSGTVEWSQLGFRLRHPKCRSKIRGEGGRNLLWVICLCWFFKKLFIGSLLLTFFLILQRAYRRTLLENSIHFEFQTFYIPQFTKKLNVQCGLYGLMCMVVKMLIFPFHCSGPVPKYCKEASLLCVMYALKRKHNNIA